MLNKNFSKTYQDDSAIRITYSSCKGLVFQAKHLSYDSHHPYFQNKEYDTLFLSPYMGLLAEHTQTHNKMNKSLKNRK